MKATVEAWQCGEDDGWNDGYHGRPYKKNFAPWPNYTPQELEAYTKGYDDGYLIKEILDI